MANILIARAYDSMYGGGEHKFSVVATDSSVHYVFGSGSEPFNADARINRILKFVGDNKPISVDRWLALGTANLGTYAFTTFDTELTSLDDAIESEKELIESVVVVPKLTTEEQNIIAANIDFEVNNEDLESEDAIKRHIVAMVDAAGTRDLNPWIEDWLAGEEIDDEDFDGLILERE